MKKTYLTFFVSFVFMCVILNTAQAEVFPYRKKYPDVPVISTQELYTKSISGECIIVDTRSEIEYNVVHIKNSVLIPFSKLAFFSENIKKIRDKAPQKAIVFYCNGGTCAKAYEATQKAMSNGFKNIFVYDAGIPGWVTAYPELTILLGEAVTNPQQQFISKKAFREKCIDYDTFIEKSKKNDTIVFDVRDAIQMGNIPGLNKVYKMPMQQFVNNIIKNKLAMNKTLLLCDQVGKQVEWLQYYLQKLGYSNYYFLNKGVAGISNI